jgi:hypothetical protein
VVPLVSKDESNEDQEEIKRSAYILTEKLRADPSLSEPLVIEYHPSQLKHLSKLFSKASQLLVIGKQELQNKSVKIQTDKQEPLTL